MGTHYKANQTVSFLGFKLVLCQFLAIHCTAWVHTSVN